MPCVDDMRDVMSSEQMLKWVAYRGISPDKMERLISVCKIGFSLLANCWGAKIEPHDLDPSARRTDEQQASPTQAAAVAASMLGKPHGNSNR